MIIFGLLFALLYALRVAVHYRYSVQPLFPAHLVTYAGNDNGMLPAIVLERQRGLEDLWKLRLFCDLKVSRRATTTCASRQQGRSWRWAIVPSRNSRR